MAIIVTARHDDSSIYKLYAVSDRLIRSVALNQTDREDPWLIALYENVNWVIALPNLPDDVPPKPFPRPSETCPEPLHAIVGELRAALEHLLSNHLKMAFLLTKPEKARRRNQKEKARILLGMITSNFHGSPAIPRNQSTAADPGVV